MPRGAQLVLKSAAADLRRDRSSPTCIPPVIRPLTPIISILNTNYSIQNNMLPTLTKHPRRWSAAFSPVEFEFEYQRKLILGMGNYQGNLAIVLTTPFANPITTGSLLYLESSLYGGYHKVTEILTNGTGFVGYRLSTPYAGYQQGIYARLIVPYTFLLYSGYLPAQTAESFDQVNPYTFVARFKPEPSPYGTLKFDISGYLQTIFNPTRMMQKWWVQGYFRLYLPGLFNQYTLRIETPNAHVYSGLALNSALGQNELYTGYINTGRPLWAGTTKLVNTCGVTAYVYVNDDVVEFLPYTGGTIARGIGADFPVSFNDDYNKPTSG
jgi:hypothetical protein